MSITEGLLLRNLYVNCIGDIFISLSTEGYGRCRYIYVSVDNVHHCQDCGVTCFVEYVMSRLHPRTLSVGLRLLAHKPPANCTSDIFTSFRKEGYDRCQYFCSPMENVIAVIYVPMILPFPSMQAYLFQWTSFRRCKFLANSQFCYSVCFLSSLSHPKISYSTFVMFLSTFSITSSHHLYTLHSFKILITFSLYNFSSNCQYNFSLYFFNPGELHCQYYFLPTNLSTFMFHFSLHFLLFLTSLSLSIFCFHFLSYFLLYFLNPFFYISET